MGSAIRKQVTTLYILITTTTLIILLYSTAIIWRIVFTNVRMYVRCFYVYVYRKEAQTAEFLTVVFGDGPMGMTLTKDSKGNVHVLQSTPLHCTALHKISERLPSLIS